MSSFERNRWVSAFSCRRYVHGVGSDDPLVWYEGAGTTNPKYLLADERGSIMAETNAAGSVVQKHQYGPYGEPINQSESRFRYTGQILLPGTELYHYKARVYHPKLGRFLQTDPIGYKDGMNWYAYVGNDPMNAVDPDGKSLKLLKAAFNVAKRMLKGDSGKDAIKGELTDIADNIQTLTDGKLGLDDAIAVVDLATGFGKEAGKLVDAAKVPIQHTTHSLNQKINRQIKSADELDAVRNPLKKTDVKYDSQGRPSEKFIGEKTTVAINPETGKVVTVHPTSSKLAERLIRQQGGEQ